MFGEKLRNYVYWGMDYCKGSPVRKHLKSIKNYIEKKEDDLNNKKLQNILEYTIREVPFYQEYANEKIVTLTNFPVVNKKIIKENYDAFQALKHKNDTLPILRTSGSTGQPFEVRQNKEKRERCYAEMMYFWGLTGYQIGQKYIYYRTWNAKNRKSKLSAFARNILMRDIVRFDEESLMNEEQFLKQNKDIKMILGYASTLENLGNFLYAKGCTPDMFGIKSIVAISESLSEPARKKLMKVFGCPVVSHYSNSENGVLAQWDDHVNGFIINRASIYLELLDLDTDEPVQEGCPGRVVITDLYNMAMPMIRYDTGDVAIASRDKNGRVILKSIEGRKIDFIYDTQGRQVSPHEVSVLFWGFPELMQYQFVQNTEKKYTLKIKCVNFTRKDELLNKFQNLLGTDAIIELEHVENIELAASGKRKYILNLWKES